MRCDDLLFQVTFRSGVLPNLDAPDAAGALEYSMSRGDGAVLWNGGDRDGDCAFSPNWQLTVLRSSVCSGTAATRRRCDLRRAMFPALLQMGARGEKFSLMGFMDKFARLCHKITNG